MIAARSIFKSATVLALSLTGLAVGHISAQTVLLDTIDDADSFYTTGSTPRMYMGDGFTNNDLASTTTSFQITEFDMFVAAPAAATYTDVVGRIQFWNTANGGTTSATNPAFANAAGDLISVDLGPITFAAGDVDEFDITLNTPVTLIGGAGTNWGFAQNFQGSTAAGTPVADTDNLTSLISSNSEDDYAAGMITTGTNPDYGYYRNANGETNFNFTSGARDLGVDYQGIGIIIFGNEVPEPSAIAAMAVGGLLLGGAVYRKRRQRA